MRERPRATISELRLAIDCLPRTTKIAMLAGISHNDIVVGAYADGNGICPMLAAHRAGGRTSLISFARAWDRFAFRDGTARRARRATERELLILSTHLEASLLEEDGPPCDLGTALAEHRTLVGRRARSAEPPAAARANPPTGDRDRNRELRTRAGWSWLRVFRRYDDYERALQRLRSADEAPRSHERELIS